MKPYIEVRTKNFENNREVTKYYLVDEKAKKTEITGKNLQIIKEIVNNFSYKKGPANSKRYYQLEEIMEIYKQVIDKKNARALKSKKANRKKAKIIRTSICGVVFILVAGGFIATNRKKTNDTSSDKNSVEHSLEINNNEKNSHHVINTQNNTSVNDYSYDESNDDYINEDNYKSENEDVDFVFNYSSDIAIDSESLENSLRYKEVFKKYGDMYGVPWQLLCAMGAQENAGIHDVDYGDPAIGIMQVERSALIGHTFKVYNFNTNTFENFTVTNNNGELEDLEYNIKVGAIELQDCIRVAFNVAVKEDKIEANTVLGCAVFRYNIGGGNMKILLDEGKNWQENKHIANIRGGDIYYIERIFDGTTKLGEDILIVKTIDKNTGKVVTISTKINNTYNKKSISKN